MRRALVLVAVLALAAFAVWIVATQGLPGTAPASSAHPPSTSEPVDAGSVPVPAGADEMTVVSIHDGDTLNLRDATGAVETVRIIGIDTPEIYPEYECYGNEATDALEELAPVGSTLRVSTDEDPLDDYDRLLLYLWNDDDVFVNLALVREGAAEAIRVRPNDRYIDELKDAERAALEAGLGMWGC